MSEERVFVKIADFVNDLSIPDDLVLDGSYPEGGQYSFDRFHEVLDIDPADFHPR